MGIQRSEDKLNEGLIPQNFNWRAGINDPNAKSSLIGDPGAMIAKAFTQSLSNNVPRVQMPPIRKSKQDQYWDAVLHNGVIWKTGNDDTRPETQQELKAQQNPIQINEPNLTDNKPNDFAISYTGEFVMNHTFTDMPINGLPNIKL